MRFAAALLLAFSACAAAPVKSDPSYQGYVSYSAWLRDAASFRIVVECSDGTYLGSGVAISAHRVLTAKHVVECNEGDALSYAVVDYHGNTTEMFLSGKAAEGVDVARLESHAFADPFVYATLGEAPLKDEILTWTGGDGDIETRLTKSGPYNPFGGFHYISAKCAPGNSGSGIFDSDGRLIGILFAGRWSPSWDFLTVFEPLENWIDLAKVKG